MHFWVLPLLFSGVFSAFGERSAFFASAFAFFIGELAALTGLATTSVGSLTLGDFVGVFAFVD
jgi:hypothetical protein